MNKDSEKWTPPQILMNPGDSQDMEIFNSILRQLEGIYKNIENMFKISLALHKRIEKLEKGGKKWK